VIREIWFLQMRWVQENDIDPIATGVMRFLHHATNLQSASPESDSQFSHGPKSLTSTV
jgi:hypothetical protein